MSQVLRFILLAMMAPVLVACTTAGPYVTNISVSGNNALSIQKCGVQVNAFTGTVSTVDCTYQTLVLPN